MSEFKIGIVYSRFNDPIEENMLKGAYQCLTENGVSMNNIDNYRVPGAFEIPIVLKKLAEQKKYDGLIALGCVIKGETAHFEYICRAVSDAVSRIMVDFEIPIGFGILTTYTEEQAIQRSSGLNNKGYECAEVILEMINLLSQLS
jgi:6,7-dimethyl-8-ribityllumazine synthase